MIRSYLTLAFRNFKKYPTQTLINLIGLSTGFLAIILIGLYIDHEQNYDRFHNDSDHIYRLTDPWGNDTGYTRPAFVPPPWAPTLLSEFPEVESYVRINKRIRYNPLVASDKEKFFEDGFINADQTFFEIFTYQLKYGNPKTALTQPNSLILTEAKALKFFGTTEVLGRTLTFDNTNEFIITGVLKDLPTQTHLDFNFLLPMINPPEFRWVYSYFKLAPETNLNKLEQKIQPLLKRRFKEKYFNHKYDPTFQRLVSIHLNSNLEYEFKSNGNVGYLYLLAAIGLVIIAVATCNYISMSTVIATLRVKEFGVRKTFGAQKNELLVQSILESLLMTCLAVSMALLLSFYLHTPFGNLLNRTFNWYAFLINHIPLSLVAIALVTFFSGVYPAFFLSSLKPSHAVQGKYTGDSKGGILRKSLIVFQFAIATVLIVGTVIIYAQLNLLKNKNPGFDREQVMVVNGRTADGIEKHADLLKNKIEALSNVSKVSFSQTVPGEYSSMANIGYRFEEASEDRIGSRTIFVSHDFIETLGIDLIAGRNFSGQFRADSTSYIINEACMKMIGWTEPIGKKIKMSIIDQMEGEVIGVMKDFNFASLHSNIEPLILVILPQAYQKVLIRVRTSSNMAITIDEISNQWKEILPDYPFEYEFMDQKFSSLYASDRQFSKIFEIFTFMALMITCFGLYSLVAFDIRKKLKDVGVRRVVGASTLDIMLLFNKKILMLILIGSVIGTPIAWIIMSNWLNNFAYSVSVEFWVFPIAFITLLLIALITTGYRIFTASRLNPVKVLRSE